MRYRPLGPSGAIVSVISLKLGDDPARSRASDWISLIYAALENGISTFEVSADEPVVIDGLSQALKGVDRRLAFVAWRLPPGMRRDRSREALDAHISSALSRTGLDYLDALTIDEPAAGEFDAEAIAVLAKAKAAGSVRFLGLMGEGEATDQCVASGGFDMLTTAFNITSGWKERNRVRDASAAEMAIVGYNSYPRAFHAAATAAHKAGEGKAGAEALRGVGSYLFLDKTAGWTAEEICLAYALTEPALATVQVRPASMAHLEQLASVPDRELPPGLAAQIEMARFSPQADAEDRRTA